MRKKSCLRSVWRRATIALLLSLVMNAAYAVPAKPGLQRTLNLTDGTTISAVLVGDEHGHYWLGTDGKAYQTVDGNDTYSVINKEDVRARAQARRTAANQRRAKRLAPRRVGTVGSYTGQKKGIIILVNFSDTKFQEANNNALYQRIANEVNFSEGNFKGSMHDYFYAQSEGQFELSFDVVGPYEVAFQHGYYGSNDSQGNDKYPAKMVIEAVKKADADVNFADYDWDDDGEVDQVYVIYAGKGEADGGASDTIWPHEWDLSSAASYGDGEGPQTLDDVKIDTYACGGELNGLTGEVAGIGTMCHEFSHCLGYPDFYDTDYSGGQGMGYWDLMDSGSYNGDGGYQPAGYTSYERWVAGWKEPIELKNTTAVSGMKALQEGGESYIIYNNGNSNEYFLLENRQLTGWDASLPAAGLLILHVDYNASAWSDNTPNDDPSHQRMTWIAADNKYEYETYQGTKYYTFDGMMTDPFPYGTVNAFGKSTTPAAKLYNKNTNGTYYLDSSVEEITQNADGTVSFYFFGLSNVATPTFSVATGRYTEPVSVQISCETEGAAIYYTLDGTIPTEQSTAYTTPIDISETTTLTAIAIANGERSSVAKATYRIGATNSDPDTKNFKRVASVDDLEPGMRYIIACGSKATAAGGQTVTNSVSYLNSNGVEIASDIITIGDGVEVFVLEDTGDGWTVMNEASNKYLYATSAKKLAYNDDGKAWKLSNGTDGVIMTYGDCGTMLYNVSSPRFTTYTSDPNTSMIQANLYMEYSGDIPDPVIMADEQLDFGETTVGTPVTKTFTVLTEDLLSDITITIDDTDAFSLGTTTISKDTQEAEVSVTFNPQDAGIYTATVTLSSEGAEAVTVGLSGTATEPEVVEPATGDSYKLVTDAITLAAGDEILIAYVDELDAAMILSTTQNTNNRAAVEATLNEDGTLPFTDGAQVITLEQDGDNFLFNVGNGYLYAASSSKNYLKTETGSDDNAKATIEINDGVATITFQGTNTRNVIRYNPNTGNGNPLFSCYASSSEVGSLPSIYRKVITMGNGDANGDGEVTIADVAVIVSYLLNGEESENFDKRAANVDGANGITIDDALGVVNIILGK